MYGIALEGGGAKGAYHIGAIKAIFENDFDIGAVVGTSIGAFNGAVTAQGDFDKLYDLWYNGDSSILIDLDKRELRKAQKGKIDIDSIKYWSSYVAKSISEGGINTEKLRKVYSSYIDEEKLRNSKIIYGTVAVSVSDRKPVYVYTEDIAEGKVADYALASSNLPVFKQEKLVDNKSYIDGGFFDNCPIKLLVDKKITDIFEIRTEAIGISRKIDRRNLNIYTVTPSKELGSILITDNENVRKNIQMGYFDTIRVIKGYLGKEYYIIPEREEEIFTRICNISDEAILSLEKYMRLSKEEKTSEPKKILFEKVLPHVASKLSDKDTTTYQKLLVAVMEYAALLLPFDMYKLYSFEEMLQNVKKIARKEIKKEEKSLIKSNTKLLILNLILAI